MRPGFALVRFGCAVVRSRMIDVAHSTVWHCDQWVPVGAPRVLDRVRLGLVGPGVAGRYAAGLGRCAPGALKCASHFSDATFVFRMTCGMSFLAVRQIGRSFRFVLTDRCDSSGSDVAASSLSVRSKRGTSGVTPGAPNGLLFGGWVFGSARFVDRLSGLAGPVTADPPAPRAIWPTWRSRPSAGPWWSPTGSTLRRSPGAAPAGGAGRRGVVVPAAHRRDLAPACRPPGAVAFRQCAKPALSSGSPAGTSTRLARDLDDIERSLTPAPAGGTGGSDAQLRGSRRKPKAKV